MGDARSFTTSEDVASHPRGERERTGPYLFLVLNAEHPIEPPARYQLAARDEVRIGGSAARASRRLERPGDRVLELGVRDRFMSASHARLRKVVGSWEIEDAPSRNGSFVNGVRVAREVLRDGDLIELGHTCFCFRSSLPGDAGDVEGAAARTPDRALFTLHPVFERDVAKVESLARSNVSVVIRGETGTGKEMLAAAIHRLSGRPGPFQAINCAALSGTLLESELFGYRKGAFSGADQDRPGLVRVADGGTLFLDEIGDLSAAGQAILLRVLQEGEVLPVGATRPIKVDLRIVVATHRDLPAMVARNHFRADLLARISGFTIVIPPLRERREDLGLLVGNLLRRHLGDAADAVRISGSAAKALIRYRWPLNIRELEKCLMTAVNLAGDRALRASDLPDMVRSAASNGSPEAAERAAGGTDLSEADLQQRTLLLALLEEHHGNVTAVARAMARSRMQIHRLIRRYRFDPTSFRR